MQVNLEVNGEVNLTNGVYWKKPAALKEIHLLMIYQPLFVNLEHTSEATLPEHNEGMQYEKQQSTIRLTRQFRL